MTAYDDLKNVLKNSTESDPTFAEFGPWLSKMTSDSNAGALDSGFDAAIMFADLAPQGFMSPYVEKLILNVIDKSFPAKASTQSKGKALALKLIEIDEPQVPTTVLLSKLNDKKVCASFMSLITTVRSITMPNVTNYRFLSAQDPTTLS
jgi:hypothetical protein